MSFPDDSAGKELACNAEDAGDVSSIPGSVRSSGERNGNPLPVLLLEKSHGQRSLEDYSPKGHKELDTAKRLSTSIFQQLTFIYIQNYIFSYTMERNRYQIKTDFKSKEPLKCLCHIMGKVFMTFC